MSRDLFLEEVYADGDQISSMKLNFVDEGAHTVTRGGMYRDDWNRPGRACMSIQIGRMRLLMLSFWEVWNLVGGLRAIVVLCEMNETRSRGRKYEQQSSWSEHRR